MENKVYTSGDLQAMGFSRTKAFEILSDPTLPVFTIGRRKYIRADDLQAWMKAKADSDSKKTNDKE